VEVLYVVAAARSLRAQRRDGLGFRVPALSLSDLHLPPLLLPFCAPQYRVRPLEGNRVEHIVNTIHHRRLPDALRPHFPRTHSRCSTVEFNGIFTMLMSERPGCSRSVRWAEEYPETSFSSRCLMSTPVACPQSMHVRQNALVNRLPNLISYFSYLS